MFWRFWQSALISLARSKKIQHFMQKNRTTSALAKKFVIGKDASESAGYASNLYFNKNIRSSLFYLGEYVKDISLVRHNVKNKVDAARALATANLDVHVSVDITQIGYLIEKSTAYKNTLHIAQEISKVSKGKKGIHCLMLDMEDASVIDDTISLYNDLKQEELPVALTLQAYLKRTVNDLELLIKSGAMVRLVKGAFVADEDIAYTKKSEIHDNYKHLIKCMFSEAAKNQGFYPIIATHDDRIHNFVIDTAKQHGWKQGQYEFEMLFGVRSDIADCLSKQGEHIRLYVPFGHDWWPYAVRRIGENPRNMLLLARSLIH